RGRERGRDGRAPRGGGARRLEAAAQARVPVDGPAAGRGKGAMNADERVRELGLEIPEIPAMPFRPLLAPVLVHDGLAYLSGIGPVGQSGVVGGDLSVEEGYAAARETALLA